MKKIIGLILLSLICQTSLATPPKPNKCPSVSAIQARGIDLVVMNSDGYSAGVLSEPYDTDQSFTFAMGYIRASDGLSARMKALESLKTLKFVSGPDYTDLTDHWLCKYATNSRYPTEAFTPANKA